MRLIDADALMVATLNFCNGYKVNWTDKKVLSWINHAPTIDAVEVVRCKDCRYWDDDRRCNGIKNGLVVEYTGEDDFCSYGERRDDNA